MEEVPICYINAVPDTNCACSKHEHGCGSELTVGQVCFVDASECMFIGGIWLASVRILDESARPSCKVGYVKTLPDQLHLVGNRVGIICRIEVKEKDIVTTILPGGKTTKTPIKQNKNRQSKNPRTLHLHDVVHDIAMLRFIDGGVPARSKGDTVVANDDDSDGEDEDDKDDSTYYDGDDGSRSSKSILAVYSSSDDEAPLGQGHKKKKSSTKSKASHVKREVIKRGRSKDKGNGNKGKKGRLNDK